MAVTRSMTRKTRSEQRCGKGKLFRRKTNRCVKKKKSNLVCFRKKSKSNKKYTTCFNKKTKKQIRKKGGYRVVFPLEYFGATKHNNYRGKSHRCQVY